MHACCKRKFCHCVGGACWIGAASACACVLDLKCMPHGLLHVSKSCIQIHVIRRHLCPLSDDLCWFSPVTVSHSGTPSSVPCSFIAAAARSWTSALRSWLLRLVSVPHYCRVTPKPQRCVSIFLHSALGMDPHAAAPARLRVIKHNSASELLL